MKIIPTEPSPTPSFDAPVALTFDELYRAQYRSTVRLAHLLTGSNAVAEDLAQDAFSQVNRRFETLDNPGGYLRTVTVNACRQWHRARFREERGLRELSVLDVETSLDAQEMADALARLSYRQRAVLVMRYWLDLSEHDIAEHLGCRPGTVKSLHARALSHLRKDLPR